MTKNGINAAGVEAAAVVFDETMRKLEFTAAYGGTAAEKLAAGHGAAATSDALRSAAAAGIEAGAEPAFMKELWGDLSEAEQKAAKDLGFDAEIWEEGGTPSRCWLPFSELKDFEQKAANLLGYASGRASDTGRLTHAHTPHSSPQLSPPLPPPPLCRYTQQIWDDENSFLESTENLMDEIADEGIDKLIAEIAKEAHEECQRPPSPPHPSGLAAKDRNWADMKEKERHAAESLGFTADGWDGGDTPYAFTLPWRRISMRAKAAAQYLGYKPEGWDKEAYNTAQARLVIAKAETAAMLRHDGTPPPGKEGAGPKDGKDKDLWEELFPEERQAARVLGYTQEAWDEGEAPQYCKVKWDELTPQLRAAAYALGYTTSVCWDWEVGQTLWYEGIEEQGPLRNPKPIRSAALQDDGLPLVHPRCTTKREDGQMRRIDEPLREPPEEEPRSQASPATRSWRRPSLPAWRSRSRDWQGPSRRFKLVSALRRRPGRRARTLARRWRRRRRRRRRALRRGLACPASSAAKWRSNRRVPRPRSTRRSLSCSRTARRSSTTSTRRSTRSSTT